MTASNFVKHSKNVCNWKLAGELEKSRYYSSTDKLLSAVDVPIDAVMHVEMQIVNYIRRTLIAFINVLLVVLKVKVFPLSQHSQNSRLYLVGMIM